MSSTFDEIVEASGLSAIFARAVVRRSVERSGLSPERLRPSDVEAVIPELERALVPFLGDAVAARIAQIRQAAKQVGR